MEKIETVNIQFHAYTLMRTEDVTVIQHSNTTVTWRAA
jgi:hypothetical protein